MNIKNQLNQALKYHEMGLNVIPLRLPGESYESHEKHKTASGKEPRIRWKPYMDRPQTEPEIIRMFEQDSNIGVIGGRPSKNLAIFDHDNLKMYVELYQKNSYFRYLADNTLSDKTYRGIHLWVFTDFPVRTTKNKELKLDIKGQKSYCVAPTSIWKHNNAQGNYLFERPSEILQVKTKDLAFLGVEPLLYAGDDFLGLGQKNYSILNGDKLGYETRSEAEFALIVKQISNGESFEYVQELFRRYASTASHYHEHDEPERYLKRTYEKAFSFYKQNISNFDQMIIQAMRYVYSIDFRTHSDRAVLLSILQTAKEANKLNIGLSMRQLAEKSNISLWTARNSLSRLQTDGWIKKEVEATRELSAEFLIEQSALQKPYTPTHSSFPLECMENAIRNPMECIQNAIQNPERGIGADVFAHYGLGKTGYKVVSFINEHSGEFSIKDMSEQTGLCFHTVKSKLNYLDLETVKRGRTTFYKMRRIGKEELERIANVKGVSGRRDKLKAEHLRERKAYREYLREEYKNVDEL